MKLRLPAMQIRASGQLHVEKHFAGVVPQDPHDRPPHPHGGPPHPLDSHDPVPQIELPPCLG